MVCQAIPVVRYSNAAEAFIAIEVRVAPSNTLDLGRCNTAEAFNPGHIQRQGM